MPVLTYVRMYVHKQGETMRTLAKQYTTDNSTPAFRYLGGKLNVYLTGEFGGGTVAIEAKAPDGDWVPLTDSAMTEKGLFVVEAAPFVGRVTLSGADGASLGVYIEEDEYDAALRVESVTL